LIYGTGTPSTIPYNSSSAFDVVVIILTQDVVIPKYATTCFALILDHSPTQCHLPFLVPPARPDFRWTDWKKLHARLEDGLPFKLILPNKVTIYMCLYELFSAVLET
jgi:hypothetical protein